jgi:hypothetical protein
MQTIAAFDRIGEENAFAVLARATTLAAQGRDIINLGIGQPDFRTPEHIVEAAVKALRDGHHGYTPAVGILPLREAVCADLHKRFKVSVSPDDVMIMPGGKPTMFMSILMFGEPGADILYPDPGFPIYRSMIEYTGARPVPVPIREENGFAFSADETLKLITPQTRLLILNSPANPTGGVTGKAEVDKLVAGLARHPDVSAALAHARGVVERVGLGAKAGALAGGLTLAERKRLELARALATEPTVLLLDEVMAGLTPTETETIVGLISDIHGNLHAEGPSKPGGKLKALELTGPQAVVSLRVDVSNTDDLEAALRALVLVVTFDDTGAIIAAMTSM